MPSPFAVLTSLVAGLLDRSRDRFARLDSGRKALTLGVVALVAFASVFGLVALGSVFDATIDREVTVDNPDRPSQSTGTDASAAPQPELTARSVHNWLSDDLAAVNSRYGFDITAAFDGAVSQQRMVSNDVVTIFETLVMWYAQQVDRNTPIEEVLGILLTEANVPVEIPPAALQNALVASDLSPDDSIADLVAAVRENDGLQL